MAKPIVLKAADVIAAARKAYEEGRLSAQGPTPDCRYRDDSGRPCAIGAAIADDQYREIEQEIEGHMVESISPSVIRFTGPITANRLQMAHDSWVAGFGGAENNFRRLIGLPANLPEA